MESYHIFGKFYDAVMGDRAEQAAHIQRLIARNKPEARTLLELGCGTGAVLKFLSKRYEVSGLDLSLPMLSIARKKLPQAQFFHKSMVTFDLGKKFDVVVCVFDSINHILKFTDWKRIFRSVSAHLEENGLFIFDINTERKLQRHIREPPYVQTFDGNLMVMDVTDIGNSISNWNIKVFERRTKNLYKLFEEDIKERSFPAGMIKDALLEKFRSVTIIDPVRRRPSNNSERLYFICRR
jgi:cyclopropane fatty-acyl-phospholipid synthase-like methyltransferase